MTIFRSGFQSSASAVIFLAIFFSLSTFGQEPACRTKDVFPWLEQTFANWEKVRSESLRIPSAEKAWLIFFDESCVVHLNPDSALPVTNATNSKITFNRKLFDVSVVNHNGKIGLPNKEEIPAGLITFASTYADGKKSFLAAALPSIWRNEPNLKAEKNWMCSREAWSCMN